MIDFTKAEIGLKVNSPDYGNGVIAAINEHSYDYPIRVGFESGHIEWLTKEGKRLNETYTLPTLRVGHFPPLEQGEIPEKKPKPLQFDGTPKWAYVSDSEDGFKGKVKRIVIAGNKINGWVAMYYGDNTSTSTVINWNYAWEIDEDE